MATVKIGLDLGYAHTILCDSAVGVYREPSLALVDKLTNRVLALGTAAENAPAFGNAVLVRPFKNGLLYSKDYTGAVIENAISAVLPADKVRCIMGVPGDFLPRQEKELCDMLTSAGVAECFFVHRAVAALIGAGYKPGISAVSVNIGASHTEIAVLRAGQILLQATAKVGGEDFDRAVKDYVSEQGDVNLSLSVARAIKEKLGAVWPGKPSESLDIEGTLSLTGSRICMNLTTDDILGVFETPLRNLIGQIAEVVKQIPISLVEEIFENGIVLSGGGAMLFGMDQMIGKVLEIPTTLAKDPMDAVAKGLSRIHTFLPAKMYGNGKNITEKLQKYYTDKYPPKPKNDT